MQPDHQHPQDGIFLATPQVTPPGVRLAVKDLFDTADLVTTYGSVIYRDHRPERTAEAVLRLQRAGYGVVGKANLHEFAWGITSENPHFGTVPNPLATGRIAGGSSGGCAAALAAGLADAGLGTDSGGSIRVPSACCGTVGFKPTFGLVPLEGCFPLAASFDHAGPMARDVAGCTAMMRALVPGFASAGPDSLDDVRVAVAWTDAAEPLVRARVEAVASLFPQRRRADLPRADATRPVFAREAAAVHAERFAREEHRYGVDVATKIKQGLLVSDDEWHAAVRERDGYRARFAELMSMVDILVTPTMPMVAPPVGVGDLTLRSEVTWFVYPFNVVGAPALAIPCGPAEDGLPASVQLVGTPGSDAFVLAVGELVQQRLAADVVRR